MADPQSSEKLRLPDNHPGLVSNVELSYVALNLGEVKVSDPAIAHAIETADGERPSLVGKQIKVRVKTFKPVQPESGEDENEDDDQEGEADEYEDENETGENGNFGGTEQEQATEANEGELSGESSPQQPTEPRLTLRRISMFKKEKEMQNGKLSPENGDNATVLEEEPSAAYVPAEEQVPKKENVHYTLLEKECVIPEAILVWEYICKFIIQKMVEGFAVRIPGLGTFTHCVMPSDIIKKPDYGRFSLRKTRKFPIFKICPHLAEMYRLIEENHSYQCNVPTVPLNTSVVAKNAKLSLGIVDGIIIETLQSFLTGIITNKNLEFPFPFIGKLYVENRKVFMIFYQQFCEGLEFDFNYAPSYIFSVRPGNMTPLAYHRPSAQFHSVFSFCDVRSVEDKITAKPRPYARGGLVRDEQAEPCNFVRGLFGHSNLLYDCSCCDDTDGKPRLHSSKPKNENSESLDEISTNTPCGYSKNYDRVRRACCTQGDNFTFQKPDGSYFSPEPLYKSTKTGNPMLDRIADDRCLLHQAIGCWMFRKVVQTLGKDTIAKHHDRDYYRRKLLKEGHTRKNRRKSYLVRGQVPQSPTSVTTIASSSVGNTEQLSSAELSTASAEEDEMFPVDEESSFYGEALEAVMPDEDEQSEMAVAGILSKSFPGSYLREKDLKESQRGEQGQPETSRNSIQAQPSQQRRPSESLEIDNSVSLYEQNE